MCVRVCLDILIMDIIVRYVSDEKAERFIACKVWFGA